MAARKKTGKSAKQNAAENASPAVARSPEQTADLIAALQKSLAREGNMPAKNARIKERLEALGA